MGMDITLKCLNCEHKWKFSLGVSMYECEHSEIVFGVRCNADPNYPQHILDFNSNGAKDPYLRKLAEEQEAVKKVFKLIKEGGIPMNNYGEEIYYCSHCNELYNHYHFEIEKDNKLFEPEYNCSTCNSALTTIKIDNNSSHIEECIIFKGKNEKRIDWHCPYCKNDKLECCEEIMYD